MRQLSDVPGTPPGVLPAAGVLESPSLFHPGTTGATDGPPAFELKFLLSEDQARAVEAFGRDRLAPDPYSDATLGGAYRTTSVYTDTPAFDVLHRSKGYAKSKFRVRRYGSGGPVFLERKDKSGDKVRKVRASVPAGELDGLATVETPADWAGHWFHRQLTTRNLRPVCRITYDRVAFMGTVPEGAVRLTFDRSVHGEAVGQWGVEPVGPTPELLPGLVICEFKFRLALPALFKEIIQALGLSPAAVSKYRRFMKTIPVAEGHADA